MSLRQIQYFVAVAKTGSLAAGARQSNVSEPALCVQIKQLEERVGAPLLWRSSRGVDLTAAGEVFLPHAIAALEEIRQAERAAALLGATNGKEISLGMMPTPGRALVVELLRACEGTPGSPKLRLREGLTDELWHLMASGQLDATLCYDPDTIRAANAIPLYREDLFLVGPPHLLNSGSDLERPLLSQFPLVLGKREHNMRKFIESAAAKDHINLETVFEIESRNLKRELLVRHGCCSIVPYGVFLDDIRSGTLYARRIRPQITRTVALLLDKALPAKIREFLAALLDSAVKICIDTMELGWRPILTHE